MDPLPTGTRQKALALNLDKAKYGTIAEEPAVKGQEPVVLMEMTLRSLAVGAPVADHVDHADFLARADILGALGHDVLISRLRAERASP